MSKETNFFDITKMSKETGINEVFIKKALGLLEGTFTAKNLAEAKKELESSQPFSEQYYFVLNEWRKMAEKELNAKNKKEDMLKLLLPPWETPELPTYFIKRLAPFYGYK